MVPAHVVADITHFLKDSPVLSPSKRRPIAIHLEGYTHHTILFDVEGM